jgi:hypothetical protein
VPGAAVRANPGYSLASLREYTLSRSRIVAIASILILASALASEAVQAQQSRGDGASAGATVPRLPLIAHRSSTDLDITMDGRIEESVWQDATPISDFAQQEPVEGGQPSEETEIRVVFDEARLYIGAIIYDDPDGVLAFQRERVAGLGTDDRFMWILDTFLDDHVAYSKLGRWRENGSSPEPTARQNHVECGAGGPDPSLAYAIL